MRNTPGKALGVAMLMSGLLPPGSPAATSYPLTVSSCGRPVVIRHPPRRAVVDDVNMAGMMFALGLQPQMAGVAGITGYHRVTPGFRAAQGGIPELAPRYPSLEQLLGAGTDLFVAGWNYGMRVGGEVTPDSLARFGIPTLVLSESCAIDGSLRRDPDMVLLYDDEERLGRVFDRDAQARALVSEWRRRVAAVVARVAHDPPVRVFLYDSGIDAPFTAGRYALATAMIRLAGGRNIFADLPTSWGGASWEAVIARDPELIVLTDAGNGTAALRARLERDSVLGRLAAVRNRRFLSVRYEALTPGPEDLDAIEAMAAAMHPAAARGAP
ncbi:MAG: ABC transporter substrate-binding protein [Gluconacetobacter diazotrophicus]|nr:ABC transporter substrate-binding protein [Gluconacetobacter diazotrophicus]